LEEIALNPDPAVCDRGGNGGAAGQAGFAGAFINATYPGGAGGAAGKAIDGDSYITFSALGSIIGARVN